MNLSDYSSMKIGEFARTVLKRLLERDVISDEEIELLQKKVLFKKTV